MGENNQKPKDEEGLIKDGIAHLLLQKVFNRSLRNKKEIDKMICET